MLTKEQALELFEYRDGALYWKERPRSHFKSDLAWKQWNPKHAGKQAGCKSGHGYVKIRIYGKAMYAHQIIFLLHNGFVPSLIDHIDGNQSNNNIQNLRESNKQNNACNSKVRSDNTSGNRNVAWHKAAKKWAARITVNMKSKHIGLFEDFEFACFVADEARRLYQGEHARI